VHVAAIFYSVNRKLLFKRNTADYGSILYGLSVGVVMCTWVEKPNEAAFCTSALLYDSEKAIPR